MPDTDETFRGPEALLQDLHRDAATICMVTQDPRFAKHGQREVHLFDGNVAAEELKKRMAEVHS
jgi:putative ABC transport system ATP-binding protein